MPENEAKKEDKEKERSPQKQKVEVVEKRERSSEKKKETLNNYDDDINEILNMKPGNLKVNFAMASKVKEPETPVTKQTTGLNSDIPQGVLNSERSARPSKKAEIMAEIDKVLGREEESSARKQKTALS